MYLLQQKLIQLFFFSVGLQILTSTPLVPVKNGIEHLNDDLVDSISPIFTSNSPEKNANRDLNSPAAAPGAHTAANTNVRFGRVSNRQECKETHIAQRISNATPPPSSSLGKAMQIIV